MASWSAREPEQHHRDAAMAALRRSPTIQLAWIVWWYDGTEVVRHHGAKANAWSAADDNHRDFLGVEIT